MTKEQRTISQQRKQIEELEKKLKDAEYWRETYKNSSNEKDKEIKDVQTVLDAMGVPGKTKGQYPSDLSITARLTLLMTMIGLQKEIKITNTRLDDVKDF